MDKLAEAGFATIPSKIVRPPTIKESTIAYESQIIDEMECGDHTLYNSKVVATHGDMDKAEHLFSIHYSKLIGIDQYGNIDFSIEHK